MLYPVAASPSGFFACSRSAPLPHTVISPVRFVHVCVTPLFAGAHTPWGSALKVQQSPPSVAAMCVKWHPSRAVPHLTTQQLSQRISVRPAALQEPLSKRPLLFCCPRCLFLQMKGQLHHMTNKLPPVWMCQFASAQVSTQSRTVGYSRSHSRLKSGYFFTFSTTEIPACSSVPDNLLDSDVLIIVTIMLI